MQITVLEEKPVPPPKKYALTLNEAEMAVICQLLGEVCGDDPSSGWKRFIGEMYLKIKRETGIQSVPGMFVAGATISSKHLFVSPLVFK